VPAGQFERFNLVGVHARDRVPGHQPPIGVMLVLACERLVGFRGGNRGAPAAFAPGQGVKPRAEPLRAGQASGLPGGDNHCVAHRRLRIFPIPEQEPAIAEQAVPICVDETGERIG